ncbi:MAG: adenylate/guanylate cyclase domain-containing response regulator [Chloroflexi bacterium]|nr:adenylate/guanylate cyclase domain-containing response regulator [Chloroflexota bacterium]
MSLSLRVLIVEDSEDDAELLLIDLRSAGYDPVAERVDTATAMDAALELHVWDLVIADYSMPHFSAQAALDLIRRRGLDLPVLVVSGTIQEDVAITLMNDGARDYLMKGNLARLIPAIERELQGASDRQARRQGELERQRMLAALSQYVHPRMALMVGQDPTLLRFGGEKRELTVLFSDLRGFSALAEALDPEILVEFLSDYLGAMTDIIFDYGGLLDKFIGDGIMAIWGAPYPSEDHAMKACEAALEMAERLKQLRATWAEPGLQSLEMGIGINTGTMIVGNLGTRRRFTYTAVGDHVNLGARLEQLNKRYGTRILVSEYTRAQLGGGFLLRELDTVRVRGRRQPVGVSELVGLRNELPSSGGFEEDFGRALEAYRSGTWDLALRLFTRLQGVRPGDGPLQLYTRRCRYLLDHPPAPDWDGISDLESGLL